MMIPLNVFVYGELSFCEMLTMWSVFAIMQITDYMVNFFKEAIE